jgi:four helix bundle protein
MAGARKFEDLIAWQLVKYQPREFARFVNIAKGSLGEVQNHMLQGRKHGYFTEPEYTIGWRLLCRTVKATNRLHAYLRSCGSEPRRT